MIVTIQAMIFNALHTILNTIYCIFYSYAVVQFLEYFTLSDILTVHDMSLSFSNHVLTRLLGLHPSKGIWIL